METMNDEEVQESLTQFIAEWEANGDDDSFLIPNIEATIFEGVEGFDPTGVNPQLANPNEFLALPSVVIWLNSLSPKSKAVYEKRLREYFFLKTERRIDGFEDAVQAYINELHDIGYKSGVIWSAYSIVCSWVKMVHHIDIMGYCKQNKRLLAQWAKLETKKKSAVFTEEDIKNYITNAPDDDTHLPKKFALAVGCGGCTRKVELLEIQRPACIKIGNLYKLTIQRHKTNLGIVPQDIFITHPMFVEVMDKYLALHDAAPHHTCQRLFKKLLKGKICNQPMGSNTIGAIPQAIATYLGKTNAKEYTGHCYRRTGATILANSGVSLLELKQAGGWRSSTVAEGYINESDVSKRKIADAFGNQVASSPDDRPKFRSAPNQRMVYPPPADGSPSTTYTYNLAVHVHQSSSTNCTSNFIIPRELTLNAVSDSKDDAGFIAEDK
jgi:hypothetical protein